MYHCLLSDLHLGAADTREDFLFWGPNPDGPSDSQRKDAVGALEQRLVLFLAERLAESAALGLSPHLLLLGDILDLWQVLKPRETIAHGVLRILENHKPVVAALRNWLGNGGTITYVIGNHDQPLVDPKAWAVLTEVLPGLNRLVGGKPTHYFADHQMGLYAEHGHQWDPFNRMRALHKPKADCPGFRIVRYVVNNLEPMIPLLDKGLTIEDILVQLWEVGSGEGVPLWTEVAEHLLRIVGSAAGPARMISGEISRWIRQKDRVPDFRAAALRQRELERKHLSRAIHPNPGGTIGVLPDNLYVVASGHTHEAALTSLESGGRTVQRLNPGTWRPVLRRQENHLSRVVQQLHYGVAYVHEGQTVCRLSEFPLTEDSNESTLNS